MDDAPNEIETVERDNDGPTEMPIERALADADEVIRRGPRDAGLLLTARGYWIVKALRERIAEQEVS